MSRAVKSKVECVSCGTTAIRRARSRREIRRTSRPSRPICPARGESVPAMSRSKVVLPDPFGPRRPSTVPRRTSKETSWMTPVGPYENETLSTRSNADSHDGAAPQRRKSQRLFVGAVRRVQHARVELHAAGEADARAQIRDHVARREKPADAAEARLHVGDLRSGRQLAERGESRPGVAHIERPLVTRPSQQAIADMKRRCGKACEAVDRKDLGVEKCVARFDRY